MKLTSTETPDYQATIQASQESPFDEVTLTPLAPKLPAAKLQLETRLLLQLQIGCPYTIRLRNKSRGFLAVERLSWEIFQFAYPKDETLLLLDNITVRFPFPKPRTLFRASEPELKTIELGKPLRSIQVQLGTMQEWFAVLKQFDAVTDFNELPRQFPCILVLTSGEPKPIGTIVYQLPLPEPDIRSMSDLFQTFRVEIAEALGIQAPMAALRDEILAKAAQLMGKLRELEELQTNRERAQTLSEEFALFRTQVAELMEIPNPQEALPAEIIAKIRQVRQAAIQPQL